MFMEFMANFGHVLLLALGLVGCFTVWLLPFIVAVVVEFNTLRSPWWIHPVFVFPLWLVWTAFLLALAITANQSIPGAVQ